ncbi:TniQ family protein [Micromonospora inaquosa]|uniref:TniQ family protein n=1 Tax=Micromonospora inaquosa TaxID=2203716 RepID=UPI0033FA5601
MRSRLPIAVAPAHHETAASYITRLAALHGMSFDELWHQVSRPRVATSQSRYIAADLLAAVTGLPQALLVRAVIELRRPEPDWLAYRHEAQRGCPRCTARHPGGTVLQLLPHHRYVCTRHHIWIGPPDLVDQPCLPLHDLPEIVAAQRAHLRLLHRLGPAATFDAVLTGFLICAHRWSQNPADDNDLDARLDWRDRADVLIPHGTEKTTFSTTRLFAVTYPEAVKLAALVGSLHWRRLAAGGPDGQLRFTTEIRRRLGDPYYRPQVTNDPIARWIDQDCWQPPSLPRSTYRAARTFGGRTGPKVTDRARDSNGRSATWFARTRRGGRAMLYHRHLTAVLVRDWSIPMTTFSATVHATANTQNFRDEAVQNMSVATLIELATAEYLRPQAAPSDYLDTAVTPAPWATRTGPKISAGRLALGKERTGYGMSIPR